MAEDNRQFILKIFEDLRSNDWRKLREILNGNNIANCNIPASKVEDLDAEKATVLFMSHYEKPLEALKNCLDNIPRKDLTQKISAKTETDMKNKGEAQNNEKFALISSCPVNTDRPPYTGKYTLFDLQDYATKNQDQLIMHLEKILKPDNFETLKKELMCSVLNKFFSFTAQKYYELFRNGELKEFLQNVSSGKKSEKIPKKLLNFMFSKKKNNRKRKAQEQMQRQGNINLKKRQLVNIDDDDDDDDDKNDDNELDKVTRGTDNEKIIQIHPIEHKPGNEDSNVTEEHWLDQDSKFKIQAIKNWYRKNNYNNREEISLNYISIHKHKAYSCFTAQDVLQFKLPDDPDYSILAILENKKDFTHSGNLKKDVEFALQFNMAVLNVKFSEVTSSNGFFNRIQANGSFAESEIFLKRIVFEIVLPVLALYKWVNLDAFKNAVYLNT